METTSKEEDFQRLMFVSATPTMIYSIYPEVIYGDSMGDHYTIEAAINLISAAEIAIILRRR